VKVILDGQTVLDSRLETPVSELHLGALKAGDHVLNILCSAPASAYVNYVATITNAATYLQKFGIMASSNVLEFPFVKQQAGPELMVLRVFSPLGARPPRPFRVHLRLKTDMPRAMGPYDEITFLEREAEVTPGSVSQTLLVAANLAQLDEGQPLFVPLGPDLPPGPYTLEVTVSAESARWLYLSRTTPGLAEKLALSLEHRSF